MRQDQCDVNIKKNNTLVKLKNTLPNQYLVINLHLEVFFVLLLWSKEGFLTISGVLKR